MSLIDNYLTQVRQLLPEKGRDDILAELKQSLEEQVESPDGSHSRDAEIRALARLGHPIKVAGRYHPQQYLIGPGIFPAYRYILGRVLVALVALHLIVSLFLLPRLDVTLSAGDVVSHLMAVVGWGAFFITLGFISVEYTGERLKFFERWTAESLQQASTRPLEFGDTVWNVLIEGLTLLWWNGILVLPGNTDIVPGNIWNDVFWPINAVVGGLFLLHFFVIARGYWSRSALKLELLLSLAGLSLMATLATTEVLFESSGHPAVTTRLLTNAVYSLLIVITLSLLWDMRKSLRALMPPGHES